MVDASRQKGMLALKEGCLPVQVNSGIYLAKGNKKPQDQAHQKRRQGTLKREM
jgi:hypothetical protein